MADTQRGLEDLARAARARSNAKIIAVTGSAGKTTTKEMLRLCSTLWAAPMLRPRRTTITGACRSASRRMPRDAEYGVFEVGMNHAGEIRNLVSFVRPHVAMITTIAPAHLEFFGSCEAIADAKSEIFEGLAPGGAALIPSDSPYAARLVRRAEQAQVSRILRFGHQGDARLLSFETAGQGMRIKADILGRTVDCLIGAPGRPYRHERGGGAGGGGAGRRRCAERGGGAERFHRAQGARRAFQAAGIEVIDESYNANPASMAAALALLAIAPGRKLAVLGDMLEMGEDGPDASCRAGRPDRSRACRSGLCLRTADESVWDVLPPARRGAYAETSAGLVERLTAALKPGDTVLVKGSLGSRMAVIVEALKGKAG